MHTWAAFLELGAAKPAEPSPPAPSDLCTIMYTSGTTGDPKVRHIISASTCCHQPMKLLLRYCTLQHQQITVSVICLQVKCPIICARIARLLLVHVS